MKTLLAILVLALAAPLAATDTEIQPGSVSMSPSNPATNTDVTICFNVREVGNQTIRFAVGFAPGSGFTYNCNTSNQVNWVLSDYAGGATAGIYRGGSLTINGVATASTSYGYTDVVGPSNGVSAGTSTTWIPVCFQTHIPPEFSGNYTLVVVPNRDGIGLQSTSCGSCQVASSGASYGYENFTVSGNPFIRLNLEVCNAGTAPGNAISFEYKVTNYGESGIRLTGLDIKFCFYDTTQSWCAQGSSNTQTYTYTGATYCNTYNPSDQFSFQFFNTVDCGTGGRTNGCYHYTLGGGPVSQSMPYYVPPNGGWTQSMSPAIYFRHCDGSAHDTSTDFSQLVNAAACGSGWSSIQNITLYNNGQLVCEYTSSSSTDQSSGIPYCGSSSGCNGCPAGYMQNMAMNASGASNVVCVPVFSPTPTPGMQLTKTVNMSQATIGDQLTFCIHWSNNASSAKTITVWDTVPSYTTYVGCDNGCSQAGGLVVWTLASRASGSSGNVCFWSTVSSYPALPGSGTPLAMLGPEDWMKGLWDRLSGKGL
jgi:uncharacterized repeat protein (TIGR01451 family)